jgi:hypothetical protein
MSEAIEIAVVHGVKISYDSEKKLFQARVGGQEIKKSSQRDVEKVISKFVKGDERVKGVILSYGWRSVRVIPIEIVGLRGRKIQYKSGDYIETESPDRVYLHNEKLLAEAKTLQEEHDAWLKRWQAMEKKAKPVDPEALK